MNQANIIALYQLAQARRQELIYVRSQLRPFDASHLGQAIYKLACQVRGVANMLDAEILPTFVDEAALVILQRMPNQYWLWWTIEQAALHADGDKPIGRDEVIHAVHTIRNQYCHKYNLRETLATISPSADGKASRESKIASRAVEGLVLVNTKPFEFDELVDNPLFFDPDFLK